MAKKKWLESHYGAYIVHYSDDDEGELIQTDWEYPRLAERFGWSLRRVQKIGSRAKVLKRNPTRGKSCDHRSTDGTIDCRDCGVTASQFISAAGQFLNSIAQ